MAPYTRQITFSMSNNHFLSIGSNYSEDSKMNEHIIFHYYCLVALIGILSQCLQGRGCTAKELNKLTDMYFKSIRITDIRPASGFYC
jgi:hypothetical protein